MASCTLVAGLKMDDQILTPAQDFLEHVQRRGYGAILADPPWQFQNRTGKVAPEHKRLARYSTLSIQEIKQIPTWLVAAEQSHLYLWVPNALLPWGLEVVEAWGFEYKTNIIWQKVRKDGEPDGRGVGFYFRNTTEMVLFGVRGRLRTLKRGRTQVNVLKTRKREHSRKPDELYEIVETCSPGPYLELFARGQRDGWDQWGNEVENYVISWPTYAHHSQRDGDTEGDSSQLEPGTYVSMSRGSGQAAVQTSFLESSRAAMEYLNDTTCQDSQISCDQSLPHKD